jgi:hypothetical protein
MAVSELPPTEDELDPKQLPDEPTHDVVFGEITEDGPNYRNVRIETNKYH